MASPTSEKSRGERDARAGKSIEAFYESSGRHTESQRAAYEIGYRAEKENISKARRATTLDQVVGCNVRGRLEYILSRVQLHQDRIAALELKALLEFFPKEN